MVTSNINTLNREQPVALDRQAEICFLGHTIGIHPGHITTMELVTSRLFAEAGYRVISASSSLNRYVRLLDIVQTLIRHHRQIDLVCLSVYGERSFVVEDVASFLCKRFHLPLVMVLHGGGIPVFMDQFPNWSRRVFKRADVIVAPSRYQAVNAAKHGFDIKVIPNLIRLTEYPFRRREVIRPRLFWMRSFHPIYNPEMAIRVVARVRETYPDVHLVMAGVDKGLEGPMKLLAQELGVADAVEFPGFLNMQQKLAYGDQSDIFINTNHVDNMPVAVIEAWAMGLPVVATNVGGIPYLLDDEQTALLVADNDVEAMAAQICRLVADPKLTAALSANGYTAATASDAATVRARWEALFAETIRGAKN